MSIENWKVNTLPVPIIAIINNMIVRNECGTIVTDYVKNHKRVLFRKQINLSFRNVLEITYTTLYLTKLKYEWRFKVE